MELISLKKLLDGKITSDDFLNSANMEIQAYISDRIQNKDSLCIYISDFDINYTFTNKQIINLLNLYLDNKIWEWDIEYISNVLDMSNIELSEKAKKIVFLISLSDFSGYINNTMIKDCINFINNDLAEIKIKSQTQNVSNLMNYRTKTVNMSN